MQSARQDLYALARTVLKGAQPDEAVVLAWPLVCGSTVADRTQALAFSNGTLLVRVPDRGWQSQLENFIPHYTDKLSKLTGEEVNRIVYQI